MCFILQTSGYLGLKSLQTSGPEIVSQQDATANGEKQRLQFGPPLPVAQNAEPQPHTSTASTRTTPQSPVASTSQETRSPLSAFAQDNPEGIRVSLQLNLITF